MAEINMKTIKIRNARNLKIIRLVYIFIFYKLGLCNKVNLFSIITIIYIHIYYLYSYTN